MAELVNYVPGCCKQIALSRGKTLRPLMEREGMLSIQKAAIGDFLVIRDLDSKKLEVFNVVRGLQHVKVVSKQIKDSVIRAVNANQTLKTWLMNDEPEFPKGLLWSGREVTDDKYAIGKWYGLHLFLPEIPKAEVEEIVLTFDAISTQNQFCVIDTNKYVNDLVRPVETFDEVKNGRVQKFFDKILPKEYSDFITRNSNNKEALCVGSSKTNTDWRYATEMPEFISVGVLYHNKKPIRFTDIILVDKDGNKQLHSMYTGVGRELVPTKENLLMFGLRLDESIVKMIYVVHQENPKTREITSSWKLFKRKTRRK